ncbi:VCBS repeat-containing protein [Ponticoccus sp. SC2-23]|uniref:FG-GAP repeat domain-containing protein n=1 Tax=Alexandriicola marinus TaxID=2081710 RepID=UPI000FDB8A7A|nr:VCBS repeat-containing protein [Alexandriicola marinus]MBM1220855.1 VCBS repeat-containing protein [Ponticoccus sp. SC6-9]MBM1225425.1 VCBS repeat-containing protein [Ponticoccus sp. SC6-15]MBM1227608.1 VCBS repeat-containing protein [Ponticoccus sp. SC6-38]MBM1234754.1 VCBS repeat-containing protein [Ponticoccus sp. SC6-45]MBM1238110.1 VCBS repeat-containing protein [Ponticoccus sp. SC6-49]MBM1244257.1 VCBS repeat-containing protein [Ponticoccus sp. SC2-64]MBM1248278.1 VCBS repeat-contai
MHRAGLVAVLALCAGAASAQDAPARIDGARYSEPTTRYAHGVLGDDEEWGAFVLDVVICPGCAEEASQEVIIRLPEARVFEDVAPRLVDVDGDGDPEVIVVESDQSLGARLAIHDETGLRAATPFIGQRFRWLAPVGATDLDGDGRIEIAYVDRPHLARTLRVWRLEEGTLVQLAEMPGLTNHRIGETDIAGGIRDCGAGPEMIVADRDWSRLMAVTFDGQALTARDIGRHEGRASFARALRCEG